MQLINAEGKPVQTGAILHGKRDRYVLVGHDNRLINIMTMDGRRLHSWVTPDRFNLQLVQQEIV